MPISDFDALGAPLAYEQARRDAAKARGARTA